MVRTRLSTSEIQISPGRTATQSECITNCSVLIIASISMMSATSTPFEPVRLRDCGPLKIILPGRTNVRRRNIEIYFQTHGVEVADIIEMDAMISTLQFVLRSDWVAILSGLICIADIDRRERVVSPIYDPPLIADFVVISPARRTLSTQAQLFLEAFETEIARIQTVWAQTIPPAVYPVRPRRAANPRA